MQIMLLIDSIGDHWLGIEGKHASHLYSPTYADAHMCAVSRSDNHQSPRYMHEKRGTCVTAHLTGPLIHYSLNVGGWEGSSTFYFLPAQNSTDRTITMHKSMFNNIANILPTGLTRKVRKGLSFVNGYLKDFNDHQTEAEAGPSVV